MGLLALKDGLVEAAPATGSERQSTALPTFQRQPLAPRPAA